MNFKRALVRVLKGTSCKSIRHLLEAKRVCIRITTMENIIQIVRCKQTFIQKAPMLGAFKNELSCIFSYVTIQLNTCYSPLWRTGVWGEDYFLT